MIKNIFERAWDILIILDACRLDTFKKINKIPGELNVLKTNGDTPSSFKMFFPGTYKNIIYISANPHVRNNMKHKFKQVITLWDEGWNYELNTVHPSVVNAFLFNCYKKMSITDKIIAHYLQPHNPFIGKFKLIGDPRGKPTIWDKVKCGAISLETVKEAYESNLELVLFYIEKILPRLKDKKIIITSDHANLLGEHNDFGHKGGLNYPELTEVPWLEVKL